MASIGKNIKTVLKNPRVLALALAFIIALQMLSGCGFFKDSGKSADLDLLKEAAQTLELPSETKSDLNYPVLDDARYGGISLSYSSGDTSVILHSGKVIRAVEDKQVIITATLKKNDAVYKKEFTVTVLQLEQSLVDGCFFALDFVSLTPSQLTENNYDGELEIAGRLYINDETTEKTIRLTVYYNSEGDGRDFALETRTVSISASEFKFNINLNDYYEAGMTAYRFKLSIIEGDYSVNNIIVPYTRSDESNIYVLLPVGAGLLSLTSYNGMLAVNLDTELTAGELPARLRLLSDFITVQSAMPETVNLTANLTLPDSAQYGSVVSFTTDNPEVITANGVITRPEQGETDNETVLTLKVSDGLETLSKSYTVTVKAQAVATMLAEVYETQGNKSRLFWRDADAAFKSISSSGTQITVDQNTKYQSLDGFGASMTHGAAYILYNSQYKSEILQKLFSKNEAGFNVVRIPIGASDFPTYAGSTYDIDGNQLTKGTLKYFSLCDVKGPAGNELANFSLDIDRQELIPVLQEALTINPDLVFAASPWSAPAWMKGTNSLNSGQLNWDTANEALYCDYLIKFIKGYAAYGINIKYISLQNEPLYDSTLHPSMYMMAAQQARLAKALSAKLIENGLNVKIQILDHNTETDFYNFVDDVLSDSDARAVIDGVAIHGYTGNDLGEELGEFVGNIKDKYPSANFYFTEVTAGSKYTDFSSNMLWAFNNVTANAVNNYAKFCLYWNYVLDTNGMPYLRTDWTEINYHCIGLMDINTSDTGYVTNAEFYAQKHTARFAQSYSGQNAVRIKASFNDPNLTVVATMQANLRIAVTVANNSSASKAVTITGNGKSLTRTLPAKSITTFTWFTDI